MKFRSFFVIFCAFMLCAVAGCVNIVENKAWRICTDDPCGDKCELDLRKKYCDFHDDPKCDRCWTPSDGGSSRCSSGTDCPADTPQCVDGTCVECTAASQALCAADGDVCKTGGGTCVQCNDSNDCDEGAPHCNADNTCGKCTADSDCAKFGKVCDAGQCVQCTPQTETKQCPDSDPAPGDQGPACHPVKKTCTGQPRGSVSGCGGCVSDSECIGQPNHPLHKCVPTSFGSKEHGSYCLQIAPAGLCPNGAPSKKAATSALGMTGEYCLPRESLTTCEAILDFSDACTQDSDCGATGAADGLCVGPDGAKVCTYACGGNRDCTTAQCTGPVGAQYCNPF